MASLQSNNSVSINTVTPSVAPVGTQSENIVPQVATALAEAGASFFKGHVIGKAEESQQEVLDQFNKELQIAEDQGTLEQFTENQMNTLVAESPEYKSVVEEMRKISRAQKQGVAPKLMLQLRAEAALKRSYNRAPGLRNEIRQAAVATLGLDPTGAMINALLNSDDSDASSEAKQIDWLSKKDAEKLSANNYPIATTADGKLDYKTNRERVERMKTNLHKQEVAEQNLESGNRIQADSVIDFETAVVRNLGDRFAHLSTGVRNLFKSINTLDDFNKAKPEMLANLETFQQAASSFIDRQYDNISVTAENANMLDESRERAKRKLLAPFSKLLESNDLNAMEKQVGMLSFFQDEMKMDFAQSSEALSRVQTVMPGWMQSVYPMIMAQDPSTGAKLQQLVRKGLNVDKNFVRQSQLSNSLDVLADTEAFQAMSDDDKRSQARVDYKFLEAATKDLAAATASPDSVDQLGKSYARLAQMMDPSNNEDNRNAVTLFANPNFSALVDKMQKIPGNEIKSEVVADSAILSLTNYVRDAGLPDISDQDGIKYNYNTGRFEVISPEFKQTTPENPGRYRGARFVSAPTETRVVVGQKARKTVKALNRAIEGVYNMKQHDMSIKDMDRAQVAQYIVGGRLGNMQTEGEPLQLSLPQPEKQSDAFDSNFKNIRDAFNALEQELDGSVTGSDAFQALYKQLNP